MRMAAWYVWLCFVPVPCNVLVQVPCKSNVFRATNSVWDAGDASSHGTHEQLAAAE